ncbi:MAG: hypothetical protein ACFE9S_07625 [Candidatus Hermodarchaeota archaeon]
MDWTEEIPNKPGYYFIREYGIEYMAEVIMTLDGPRSIEFQSLAFHNPFDLPDAEWLGPIKSEDIINLWVFFKENKG